MKRASLLLVILMLVTVPAFAQSSEFGFLIGGSKRIADFPGSQGQTGLNDFKFSNSVKEAFYGIQLDPETYFKIKVGEISGPVALSVNQNGQNAVVDSQKGKIEHIDALVDYKFSEPFGSTGLFAGVGMYRLSASGQQDETNFGLSGGVNADFPLSRRYGLMAEAAFHWLHTDVRQRYVTLTGGLRISF